MLRLISIGITTHYQYQYIIMPFICNRLKFRDSRFHGTDGPLDVANVPYASKLRNAFLLSAKEFGYKLTDYNGPRSIILYIGFSHFSFTLLTCLCCLFH